MTVTATRRFARRLLATAAALVVTADVRPLSAVASNLEHVVQSCASATSGNSARGWTLELLMLAGSNIDQTANKRYKAIAESAIGWACAVGAKLEIRPIDARSQEEGYVFSATAPSVRGSAFNPYILRDKRAAFLSDAVAAIDAVYARQGSAHADFVGGINNAARATAADSASAHVVIMVVGHGWQQVPDLFRTGIDPAKFTGGFIAALRSHGQLSDLHRATVVFVGVSSGPREMGQSRYLESLCSNFWAPVIRALNGTWGDCWPEPPPFLRAP